MSRHHLDMAKDVLDRQVVDANRMLCGKVDDLEIDGTQKLKVIAILIGNGAASSRLPQLAKDLSRKLFGRRTASVDWSDVDVVAPHQIKLKLTAQELGLDERSGLAYKIISSLPLSWKK